MTVTVSNVIAYALQEHNVLLPGESLPADLAATCLQKLNRLLDNWNAQRSGVYAERQQTYTMTPALQPHTWGPTAATFSVTERPATLEGASIVLNGAAPNANIPLSLIDYQTWQSIVVPTVTASVPEYLYYQPLWPNAALYLWPVPTTAYGLLLQWRIALSQVTLVDSLNLPQGYIDAVILTLAEDIADIVGRQVSPLLEKKARQARARIFNNNDVTRTLVTQDAGMPSKSSSGTRADFNYLNGQVL